MKKYKIITFGILIILFSSMIIGVQFSDKQEAMAEAETIKANRELELGKFSSNIISQKPKCSIDVDTLKTNCKVCFSYTVIDGRTKKKCLDIDEKDTQEEIDYQIDKYVNKRVRLSMPKVEISYEKGDSH